MRFRIIFSKTDAMRFTSHLDLYRTWERTFRRAGLSLLFSQGFNPRPRIQLAAALPLGYTSVCEVIDVWLTNDRPLHEIEEKLIRTLPPGLSISDIYLVDPDGPALQRALKLAVYEVEILEHVYDIQSKIDKILNEPQLLRTRRGKEYDLRPLIVSINELPVDDNRHKRIQMVLSAQEGKTGRPEEILAILGISFERTRIQRERLVFEGAISDYSW
jgi:radical SAM-linked protein